ncbi:MAG: hypothetical protein Q8S03_04860 [Brevundimonas sp.]|uniref:hypothetical protein n=1 Tax=Brevundimonas sp. TaxID=1871086 RepID=UPI002733A952|nr:hypothetical protein [Brevundimonas sp.]MDP3404000.1 hypothetical protein [Brevundimonas sp.]
MAIRLALNEKGEVSSPFISALAGSTIRLWHDETKDAHPFVAHGLAYRGFERSSLKFLDRLEQVTALTGSAPDQELALAFGDVVYRAAEAFEFYKKRVPAALSPPRVGQFRRPLKDYDTTIRRLLKHWATVCNAMKHASNIMVPVVATFERGTVVHGYSVCGHVHEGLALNKDIHRDQRSFAYAVEIKRLIHDLLRADLAAARLVTSAPTEGAVEVRQSHSNIGLAALTARLNGIPAKGLPECVSMADSYTLTDGAIILERSHVAIMGETARVSVAYTVQEATRHFPLP